MRTRSTATGSLDQHAQWHLTYYPESGSYPILSTANTYFGSRKVKTITDVETPGFQALKKCGKFLPLNPVTISTETETIVPREGYIVLEPGNGNPDTGYWYRGQYADPWNDAYVPAVPPLDAALSDAVVIQAKANAASDKWDFLTFIAELRGTVEVMAELGGLFNFKVNRLAVEAAAFKKNPWKRFRELWLAARYGIRPIIYDYYSAAKAVERLMNDVALLKGTGYQRTEFEDIITSGQVDAGNWFQTQQGRTTVVRTYRSAAYIEAETRLDAALSADPLVTAWELTTLSFVYDWFIDIGGWVAALTPELRGDFAGTSVSWKTVVEQEYKMIVEPKLAWPFDCTPTIHTRKSETYVRGPHSGLPLPSLLPNVTLPKLVDLVAIFVKGRNRATQILNRR